MAGRTYDFFLGANTPRGFFSYYDDLIDLTTAKEVYAIKGGPGTGKSSFMRKIAGKLVEKGLECEYILCSSDPDSLDGVVFPEIGVAFVDATAPHVVEPKYAYAVERYLHVGEFVDADALEAVRGDIIAATDGYRECYAGAYRCIYAAGEIDSDMSRSALTAGAIERTEKRARGIAAREFSRKTGRAAKEKRRFLTAHSPKGVVTLDDTVWQLAGRVYEISEAYGLAAKMLAVLRDAALESGYDVISCYSPLYPDTRLAHLFVPELKLAFTTCAYTEDAYRRIHLDGYLDRELLLSQKQRLKFLRRTRDALLGDAVSDLAEAKRRHDALEKLYNGAVDFDGLFKSAEELADRLIEKYL